MSFWIAFFVGFFVMYVLLQARENHHLREERRQASLEQFFNRMAEDDVKIGYRRPNGYEVPDKKQ